MKKYFLSITIVFLAMMTTGCAPKVFHITTQNVNEGYFAGKDYKITAIDGSFEIKSGEYFTPPFSNDMYGCYQCEQYYLEQVDFMDPQTLLNVGGKKVKIQRGNKEVHGILVLNKVFTLNSPTKTHYALWVWTYSKPSLRNYEIIIPDSKFNAALNGRTSLVYEIFAQVPKSNSATNKSRQAYSWLLLMSRHPF